MAGLELLYACASASRDITCPQDALICFVHWEIVKSGFKCIGTGDEARSSDKKSELLPKDWSSNKELYSLRYEADKTSNRLLLKAIYGDSTMFLMLLNSRSQQVSQLAVNLSEHVDPEQLYTYSSVFKDADGLSAKVATKLLPSLQKPTDQAAKKAPQSGQEAEPGQPAEGSDPLLISSRHPRQGTRPHMPDPIDIPFGIGGADLDPFGVRGGGGMILDPLRSGFPRSGFDPSTGVPDILPPGAVPPGARFDPIGPLGPIGPRGRHRPGPDPDHLPPPGYDDMFM